jgi:hypothetical protein
MASVAFDPKPASSTGPGRTPDPLDPVEFVHPNQNPQMTLVADSQEPVGRCDVRLMKIHGNPTIGTIQVAGRFRITFER